MRQAGLAIFAAVAVVAGSAHDTAAQQKVLRHVQHAYFVYDQPISRDEQGQARPQMVESYNKSADGKAYRFTLRAGLRFNDGTPVRAVDAVASIKRWALFEMGNVARRG